MKYLLFDENAIAVYVSEKHLQSVEFLNTFVVPVAQNCYSILLFSIIKTVYFLLGKSEMWIQNVIQISIFFALT